MHAAPRVVQDSQFSFPAGFSAAHRLLRKEGFNRAIHAESMEGGRFKIFFVRSDKNNARLGIIADKRTLPRATDRNRVKRVIREAFRQHDVKFCKMDMVVMVRRAEGLQKTGAQRDSLKRLFSLVENRCTES